MEPSFPTHTNLTPTRRILTAARHAWQHPKTWNAKCLERGHLVAMLPKPPLRDRIRTTRIAIIDTSREELARKIAPWLLDDK